MLIQVRLWLTQAIISKFYTYDACTEKCKKCLSLTKSIITQGIWLLASFFLHNHTIPFFLDSIELNTKKKVGAGGSNVIFKTLLAGNKKFHS